MNYLLDSKQDLLVIPNGVIIASNQQSAISNRLSLIFIVRHYILLCFFPLCPYALVIPIDCR